MNKIKYRTIILLIAALVFVAFVYQNGSSDSPSVNTTSHNDVSPKTHPINIKPASIPSQKKVSLNEASNIVLTPTKMAAPPQRKSSQPFDSRAPKSKNQHNPQAKLHGHEHSVNGHTPRPPSQPTQPNKEPPSGQ